MQPERRIGHRHVVAYQAKEFGCAAVADDERRRIAGRRINRSESERNAAVVINGGSDRDVVGSADQTDYAYRQLKLTGQLKVAERDISGDQRAVHGC